MLDEELQLRMTAEISNFQSGMTAAEGSTDKFVAAIQTMQAQVTEAIDSVGVSVDMFAEQQSRAMTRAAASAKEAAEETTGAFARINEGAESLEAAFTGLGEIFLIGAAIELGHKFLEIAGEANEAEVALLHLSDRTGLTVQQVNALAGVASLADVPTQSLARAITQLSRQMVEAEQGSKTAVAAFAAFGLSVDELKGKNPHEVFLELADAISKSKDSMEKTGEAATLLGGRVGTALLPVLDQGRKGIEDLEDAFTKLNPLTKEQAEQADELHKSWVADQLAADSLYRSITNDLGPALIKINGWLVQYMAGLRVAASIVLHPLDPAEWQKAAQAAAAQEAAIKLLSTSIVGPDEADQTTPKITKTGGAAAAHKAAEEARKVLDQQLSDFTNEQHLEVAVASQTADQKVAAQLASFQRIATEAAALAVKAKPIGAELHNPQVEQKFVNAERDALTSALELRRGYLAQLKALDSEQISTIAKEKDEQLAIVRARLDQEFDLNRIDDQQKIAGEIDLVNQQLAIDTKAVGDKMALYAADSKEYAKLVADKISLELKAQAEIIKLQTDGAVEAANATREAWDSAFGELSTGLDDVFNTLSQKSHHMGEEWRKMWAGMAKSVIESGITDLLFGGSKGSLGGDIFGEKGKGGGVAGLVANNADGFLAAIFGKAEADSIGERLKTITGGAGGLLGWLFGTNQATGTAGTPGTPGTGNIAGPPTPGAAGGAAGSGAAGVTTGLAKVADALGLHQVALALNTLQLTLQLPALIMNTAALIEDAAIKAATAVAGIFTQGGIVPSAAGGMVMGGGGSLAILHPREMVLPANISGGLQNMISHPSPRNFSQDSPAANATRANQSRADQSAGHQFHTHFSPQTPDPKAMDRFFKTNERRINASMMRSARKANLI